MLTWFTPLGWFSDPAWLVAGNLVFWPGYVAYLHIRARIDRRQDRAQIKAVRERLGA